MTLLRAPRGGESWLPAFSCVAAGVVIAIGSLICLSWVTGLIPLSRPLPTAVAMNPVTAILFVLAGTCLWRLAGCRPQASGHAKDHLSLLLALVVAAAGAWQIADYVFHLGMQIEHLLFANRVASIEPPLPNRPAPNSAMDFFLCGVALVLLDRETPRRLWLAQLLMLASGFIALVALIGYTYRILILYRFGMFIPMSLEAAVCFAALSAGFLAARPSDGFMRVITSPTTGGAVARRLLPVAILMPWLLGALLLMGEQAGRFGRDSELSIFAVATIVIFTALIWWNANLLYLADIERVRSERRRAIQHETTRVLASSSTLATAAPELLRGACERLGCQTAALWMLDPGADSLRCFEFWHSPADKLSEFAEVSRKTVFAKGIGLPGQVWAAGGPVWIADVASVPDLLRLPAASKAGLKGTLGFPVKLGQEFLGVLEFHSRDVVPLDEMLAETLTEVAIQLGLFIERSRAEEQLRRTSANLERSNTELQQFAYVASHDLFEPLRMIISYLQLLNERYESTLDPQAKEFISFAIDGARRMQALIQDLLEYSRVDIRGRAFAPTNCELVFRAAMANLKVALDESKATVTHGPLPIVKADSVQLTQLFQNLLGNAVKFHRQEPPLVDVAAQPQHGEWVFSVRDNGIGIDPKHFDRIFVIFQRLHTRQEYSGTGMGLAICKKIVERHGGRIWVESSPGQGSTFFFTLPKLTEEGEPSERPSRASDPWTS